MDKLAGKTILVIEDEYLVALMAADMLQAMGATVRGPVATLADGLAQTEDDGIDAVVLDANLRGESSAPIAEQLHRRGTPFILATGYGAHEVAERYGVPVVNKPYSDSALGQALQEALAG